MVYDDDVLRAVIDCIIPPDQDPGALDLGTDGFVKSLLAKRFGDEALIAEGLSILEEKCRRSGSSFATLPLSERTDRLEAIEREAWFERLVTIVSQGYYADPDNGGNAGARSWQMIGYRHGLAEGPSGPPEKKGDRQHDGGL